MKNPISVEGLAPWLEQQDPDTEYDFCNVNDCLLCRYLRATGLPVVRVAPVEWIDTDENEHTLPAYMNAVANGERMVEFVGNDGPPFRDTRETYGAALSRCYQVMGK